MPLPVKLSATVELSRARIGPRLCRHRDPPMASPDRRARPSCRERSAVRGEPSGNWRSSMSQRRPGYEVGYGKPPQYTRFRKGQSGNPKGRPKGLQSFARLARQAFNEKIAIKENGERRTITKLQAALKQLANKAASGDAAAIREVLRLQAAIAEIIPAEDQHDYTGKHGERPNPAETDPSRIALALLTLLHTPTRAGSR